jgi:hypothetical protein
MIIVSCNVLMTCIHCCILNISNYVYMTLYIVMHILLFCAVIFADGHFTMEILSQLEQIGITSLRELEAYKSPLQSVVGMDNVDLPTDDSFSLLEMWVQGYASLRPTWRHFFWALREIKLNHLADQIEASLSGMAVEQAATSALDISPGSEEIELGREEQEQG